MTPPATRAGYAYLEGTLTAAPDSQAAYDTIDRVRSAMHAVPGASAVVGGGTATSLDVENASAHDRNLVIPVILAVVFIILGLLLRALVAPLNLTATVVLSFAAALGVSAVFFDHVFGFGGADTSFPLWAFVFLVALGIDYNIFLMIRVREEAEWSSSAPPPGRRAPRLPAPYPRWPAPRHANPAGVAAPARQTAHQAAAPGGTPSAARSWRRGRTPAVRDQVAGQDRVHLILDPGPLPDQVRPAGHLTAQLLGPLIRQPHRRQEVRGQQLRQDSCVELRILRTNRTRSWTSRWPWGRVRRGSEPLGMIALEALIGGPPEIFRSR